MTRIDDRNLFFKKKNVVVGKLACYESSVFGGETQWTCQAWLSFAVDSYNCWQECGRYIFEKKRSKKIVLNGVYSSLEETCLARPRSRPMAPFGSLMLPS